MWKQKRRRSSTALKNMTCEIFLNIGSIICSCVSNKKGTILKAIVVDFLKSLNRKSYRHSLVFLCVSNKVYMIQQTGVVILNILFQTEFSMLHNEEYIKPFMSLNTLKTIYYSYFNAIINYVLILRGNSPRSIKIFKMPKKN
jgi:hypothetical protein